MINTSHIKKLPANTLGKDYVIGDLHGCFDLLETLLQAAEFNPSIDRLFSVGDLIDRGNNSLKCLELLFEPWFYPVQGNHELMMLDFFAPYIRVGQVGRIEDLPDNGFLEYGGQWVLSYFLPHERRMSDTFNRCIPEVFNMPIMIVVGEGKARFHIIHAELTRPDYKQAKNFVWLDSDIDGWLAQQSIPKEVEDRLYWSRTLMMGSDKTFKHHVLQEGLSRTFCGHTPDHSPRRLLSHINVDTGAFIGLKDKTAINGHYSLTLFDIHQSKWIAASYQHDDILSGLVKAA